MKRIVTFGMLAAVAVTAVLVCLSILDVVSGRELRDTLVRSLAVIAVSTTALVLLAALLKMGRSSTPAKAGSHDDR